jgi:hypothetical protein
MCINDVATFPGYGGRGIAKKLMQMANEYAKEQGLEHAILSADPHGFPRSNIYLKDGYHDHVNAKIYIHFTNAIAMVSGLPLLFPAVLGLFLKQFLPIKIAAEKIKSEKRKNQEVAKLRTRITYPTKNNRESEQYRLCLDRISRDFYNGFSVYTPELWKWAKESAPIKSLDPSLIALFYGEQQIGGIALRIQNLYSTKYRFKIPVAIIHEGFLDEKVIPKEIIPFAYLNLVISAVKEAQRRKAALSIYNYSENQQMFEWSLQKLQFHAFGNSAIMIKSSKYVTRDNEKRMFHTNPNITWAFQ